MGCILKVGGYEVAIRCSTQNQVDRNNPILGVQVKGDLRSQVEKIAKNFYTWCLLTLHYTKDRSKVI